MLPRIPFGLLLLAPIASGQVLAEYDAGTAGAPATAPDPQAQGWTLVDPSGGGVLMSPLSPDGASGLNAWRVDDPVTFTGGRAHYTYLASPADLAAIEQQGFSFEIEMRVVSGTTNDLYFEFSTGNTSSDDRYLLFLYAAGPDVIANDLLSGNALTCAGAMDGGYHSFEIRRGPLNQGVDAELLFDGQVVGPVFRANSSFSGVDGGVAWGSGSSAATAVGHFHAARFAVGSLADLQITCDPASPHAQGDYVKLDPSSFVSGPGSGLHLEAIDGPVGEFGFVLVSADASLSLNVFNGVLCLGSPQGRYNPLSAANQGIPALNSLGQFDAAGVLQSLTGNAASSGGSGFDVPLALPFTPAGQVIAPGDTYYFQLWYRDQVVAPGDSANFSNVLEATFP